MEARNREARAGTSDPPISRGLQGDAIQPLSILNQGECLWVVLRNALENNEPPSFQPPWLGPLCDCYRHARSGYKPPCHSLRRRDGGLRVGGKSLPDHS